MDWNAEDPRYTINKRRTIIISDGEHAREAHIETNHGWHIEILGGAMAGLTWIRENDIWPSGWLWTDLPRVA